MAKIVDDVIKAVLDDYLVVLQSMVERGDITPTDRDEELDIARKALIEARRTK